MIGRSLIAALLLADSLLATSSARPRDPAFFPQPHARCMAARPGRILTAVGRFPAAQGSSFEVVADTRLIRMADRHHEFGDPSVNVFGAHCELVWRKSFPSLAEAGFQTLARPRLSLLLVVAISVFEPVDQILTSGELLSAHGDTLTSALSFGADRFDIASLGRLDGHGGLGLVTVSATAPIEGDLGAATPSNTLVWRWQDAGYFVGPEPMTAAQITAWQRDPSPIEPPFPLSRFLAER